jgi:membrane protein implicated in regulation of membrane protease activity
MAADLVRAARDLECPTMTSSNADAPGGAETGKGESMQIYLWLGVAVILAVVEAVSLTLITVWFVVGALAAFVAALLGFDWIVQIVVFLAVSVLCLVLLRPLALKHRNRGASKESTPVSQYAVVTEAVDNTVGSGRVETPDHMSWAAISADGLVLLPGTRVQVVDQKSVRLVVAPLPPYGAPPAPPAPPA